MANFHLFGSGKNKKKRKRWQQNNKERKELQKTIWHKTKRA